MFNLVSKSNPSFLPSLVAPAGACVPQGQGVNCESPLLALPSVGLA